MFNLKDFSIYEIALKPQLFTGNVIFQADYELFSTLDKSTNVPMSISREEYTEVFNKDCSKYKTVGEALMTEIAALLAKKIPTAQLDTARYIPVVELQDVISAQEVVDAFKTQTIAMPEEM